MAGRYRSDLNWSDVTPKAEWLNRRQIMTGAAALGLGSIAAPALARFDPVSSAFSTDEEPTSFEDITSYNNFYEFGTGKSDPARNAGALQTEPWPVVIDGLVDRPGTYDFDEIVSGQTLEERIYRFRCVEAWSSVVPWVGFELKDLLDRVGVQPSAKYVAFETAVQEEVMVGVQRGVMDFPFVEGLRLDEAMHPLTIVAVGVYDEPMPKQKGAPMRLVVPWKYGFKSIKSVVRISLVEDEPPASWNQLIPREYGFYSNVNPERDHPRWSQKTERRIGEGLFARRIPTLKFNGYGEEVASLYAGMDLVNEFY